MVHAPCDALGFFSCAWSVKRGGLAGTDPSGGPDGSLGGVDPVCSTEENRLIIRRETIDNYTKIVYLNACDLIFR